MCLLPLHLFYVKFILSHLVFNVSPSFVVCHYGTGTLSFLCLFFVRDSFSSNMSCFQDGYTLATILEITPGKSEKVRRAEIAREKSKN